MVVIKECIIIQDVKPDNIYIKCNNLIFQIVILHQRGNFLWISNDDFKTDVGSNPLEKPFGDTPRAINTIESTSIIDENSILFIIPTNVKRFLFDYDHSMFIECNKTLAERNLQINGVKYQQDVGKNFEISKTAGYITKSLENFHKHYWLAGGTLLGWYRDCGLIPHTRDFDMAIWSHESDDRIKNHFLANPSVTLIVEHGMV